MEKQHIILLKIFPL